MFTHTPYTRLNCGILDHILNNFCPQLFFPFFKNSTIDNFCHHVKTPAARGSAMFHSMENRWQGRDAKMDAWKEKKKKRWGKKTLTHWDSHWDPARYSTHSPNERNRRSMCLCLCINVWWVGSLRVLVKAVYLLWCVLWGKLSQAGHHAERNTLFLRSS